MTLSPLRYFPDRPGLAATSTWQPPSTELRTVGHPHAHGAGNGAHGNGTAMHGNGDTTRTNPAAAIHVLVLVLGRNDIRTFNAFQSWLSMGVSKRMSEWMSTQANFTLSLSSSSWPSGHRGRRCFRYRNRSRRRHRMQLMPSITLLIPNPENNKLNCRHLPWPI